MTIGCFCAALFIYIMPWAQTCLAAEVSAGGGVTREDFFVETAKLLGYGREGAAAALPFADTGQLKPGSGPYIQELYSRGHLSGVSENGELYIRPGSAITRQDAAAFLGRALGVPEAPDYDVLFADGGSVAPYAQAASVWLAGNGLLADAPGGGFDPLDGFTAAQFDRLLENVGGFQRRSENTIETVTGAGSRGYLDGNAETSRFTQPYGVFTGPDGSLVVLDTYNNILRRVDAAGAAQTMAGSISSSDDTGMPGGGYRDGRPDAALFNRPSSGAVNSKAEIFIADSKNNVIRLIKDGHVYTFSGSTQGHADGAAQSA